MDEDAFKTGFNEPSQWDVQSATDFNPADYGILLDDRVTVEASRDASQGYQTIIIGGADLNSGGMSATTMAIANATGGTAYSVNWGNVIGLAGRIASNIKGSYVKGQSIKIYSYSEGGNVALQVSRALNDANIPVSILFTVDAADGPFSIDHTLGANVSTNYNFYQLTPSPIWSHGDSNTGPGTIFNVNLTGPDVTHGNIDELMMNYAITILK